jgi:hypothetical protein
MGSVADEEIEGARIVREGPEAEGRDSRGLEDGIVAHDAIPDLLFGFVDFMVHEGLLHDGEAHGTPAGGDHVVDERGFEGRPRLEFIAERLGELGEFGFGFGFEEDGFAEGTVTDGVLRGVAFALGRDRSAGFGAVDTGGLELSGGLHGLGVACARTEFSDKAKSLLITQEKINGWHR